MSAPDRKYGWTPDIIFRVFTGDNLAEALLSERTQTNYSAPVKAESKTRCCCFYVQLDDEIYFVGLSIRLEVLFGWQNKRGGEKLEGNMSDAETDEVVSVWRRGEQEREQEDGRAAGCTAPPSDPFSTTGGQLAIKMAPPPPPRLTNEKLGALADLRSKHSLPECPAKINIWIFSGTPKPA